MALPTSPLEITALCKFRDLVNDLNLGDGILMRFLRARNLDAKTAEKMLRSFQRWKVEAPCNRLVESTPPELDQFKIYLTGFDGEDRPVVWVRYGHWPSVRDLMERGLTEDILKYAGNLMQKLHNLLLETKQQQFVAMVDVEGLTFSKIWYEAKNWAGFSLFNQLLTDYEANYPELLHRAYIFQTPMAFLWAWKFFSHCFSDYTRSKITISADQFDEECLSLPRNVVPEIYGGCSTPICLRKI